MDTLSMVKKMSLAMQRYPWEQGVLAQAFLESGDEETAILLAREAVHRQMGGRPAMMADEKTVTDPVANGEAMLFAYNKTKSEIFSNALDEMQKWIKTDAPHSPKGILYHVTTKPEFWVDSFYMLPPYLAANGEFEEAVKQIDGYWEALYLEDKGLLGHIIDAGENKWVRRDVWGVGNGWAMAGMARVVSVLPRTMPDAKNRLIERIKLLLDNSAKWMRSDFLFHDVLDDEKTFVETNFPQMFAYTVFRGVKEGWLDDEYKNKYLETARSIRKAVHGKVDEFGLVTGVCGAPDFDKAGSATEGQAFFILMEALAF